MLRSSTCGTDTTDIGAADTFVGDSMDFGQSVAETEMVGVVSGGVRGALAGSRAVDGVEGLVLANRTPSYWTPFISMQTINWGSPVSAFTGN